MTQLSVRRRYLILATVCLAAFAINLDTTIVNVALPDLGRELQATTRDLQWIVDGYNLAFAALVLTAGSLGDRFGRRPALLIGLGGFAAASAIGALVGSANALIAVRFTMGAFAALIFPTTLSIITNTFPERRERAKAVGIWGAVTGLGVAVGPVTGGFLLAHYSWPSVFIALVPVAVVAMVAAFVLVPESRDPDQARLDPPGLIVSSAAIGLLVYTIIEAPRRGWSDPLTIWSFVAVAILVASFVAIERRRRAANDRCVVVPHAGLLGGERRGDGGVLCAVRIHLPGDAIHAIHPRLGDARYRRADPASGDDDRPRVGGWRCARDPHRHPRRRRYRPAVPWRRVRLDRALADVHDLRPNRRADGLHRPRPGPDDRAGYRIDSQRAATGKGGRRVSCQ